MKQFITFLAAALTSLSAAAGFGDTRLTISSSGHMPVRVVVDGNRYSSNGGDEITIRNLQPGYHTVKIFQRRNTRGPVRMGSSNYQVVYSSQVLIKRQFHTDITVNRFGKVLVDEQQMSFGFYDEDDDEWGDNGWNNDNGGWNNGGQQQVMNDRVFEQFKQTLRNESFDNSRLSIAKQTIGSNLFTAQQVKEVVSLFTFDNGKLEIAKYAYDFTVDKGSYFIVNDAFTYSSSKEELAAYIRNKR